MGRHEASGAPVRRFGRRTLMVTAAVGVSALVLGGVAVASIPSSNGGKISACVKTTGGAVRIIDHQAGKRCASGERLVEWSRLVSRGSWSSTTSYAAGDIVQSGGSTYLARVASKGRSVTSATYWTVLAAKGDTGAQGLQGPQGAAGPKGDTGAQGPAGPSLAYSEFTTPLSTPPRHVPGSSWLVVERVSALPAGKYTIVGTASLWGDGAPADIECDMYSSPASDVTGGTVVYAPSGTRSQAVVTGALQVAEPTDLTLECLGTNNFVVGFSSLLVTRVGDLPGRMPLPGA